MDIMRLCGKLPENLEREAYSDKKSVGPCIRQGAVIESLSAAQAHPTRGEGQPGTEEDINLRKGDFGMPLGNWFPDSKGSRGEKSGIAHLVKVKSTAYDSRIAKSSLGKQVMEFLEARLVVQGGEARDGPALGAQPRGKPSNELSTQDLAIPRGEPSQGITHLAANSSFFLEVHLNCHLRIVRSAKTIQPIPMFKQATALLLFSGALVFAQTEKEGEEAKIDYKPPVVEKVIFDESITMLDQERHEYSSNLAIYAANQLISKKASPQSLESARRILALALHLERRNRQALVVNFQLKQGVMPEIKKGDYNPRTFSRLLLARAKLLLRDDNERERLLAHCFVELAAIIDPRNEDAVFAYENQRIDVGDIDWRLLTDAVKDKPSRSPALDQ